MRPKIVIEVSYQDLYVDRKRPVYAFESDRYVKAGFTTAVTMRPYLARRREDKRIDPWDLRLEQVDHLADRIRRIRSFDG